MFFTHPYLRSSRYYVRLLFFWSITAWFFIATPALAAQEDIDINISFAKEQTAILAVLQLNIPEGYYIYAPGNLEGKPTSVSLVTPTGSHQAWFELGEKKNPLASAEDRIYRRNTYIFLSLPHSARDTLLNGKVEALLCSDARCLPQSIDFRATIPSSLPNITEQPWQNAWIRAQQNAPQNLVVDSIATPLEQLAPAAQPIIPIVTINNTPQITALPNFEPRYEQASLEVHNMGKALFLGFFAGLLLNIMPCVLPVLTLKISGLLIAAHGDPIARYRQFREHNLFFALGIMTWFSLLALVLGLAGFMWGQFFQNQGVILGVLLIVFLLALSMLGVFTLPMIDLKSTNSDNPRLQAFSTGLLATLLATPCSGPLLGGVLGWAFTQPVTSLAIVFCAVGLGMSCPYIIFAFRPHLVRILPRPGAWMGVLEKVMGFFLLGTTIYLLSILPAEKHLQVLIALLLVAVCAWLWGQFCGYNAPARRRRLGRIAGICLILCGLWWALQPPQTKVQWEPFTQATFSTMLGKQPMLVEFTADWCPNCKFLEASVLTDRRLHAFQKQYGVKLIRVDLTQEDKNAQSLLESLGARSIPVTALFATGQESMHPLVLRDVYSAHTLESAMHNIFGNAPGQ